MLQPASLQFLNNLAKNNSKEWFEKNRKLYELTKADFAVLAKEVISDLGTTDIGIANLQPKDCLFRINRDVRFSKNKAPYKTNMGMSLAQGGKKSILAGYYFHFEPGGKSFVGGGKYMAEPDTLSKIRQEIDYAWDEFSKLIKQKKFVRLYGDLQKGEGLTLIREPKGYEKSNPAIAYLKLKSWIATTAITDADLTNKTLKKKIVNAFEIVHPLISFLNRALAE